MNEALAPISEELRRVAHRVLAQLADPIARRVVYLVTAGGKRLRPALVLLTGRSGPSQNREALVEAAAAVELIHTATLVHDDIIDQSTLRRSRPTFHHRWGTERAVLMGDYLYATAFTQLAQLGLGSVTQVMANVCRQLCRGELREVEARYRLDLTEQDYLDIIKDKTASLIGGCCQVGALLGGSSPEAVARLTTFGIRFGLAFQIIDDCLDLTATARQLGKAVLHDLDRGVLSLPLIYLMQDHSARARREILAPLRRACEAARRSGRRALDPVFLARVAEAARESGAIRRSQARAETLIRDAQDALLGIPMNGLTRTYRLLADYAITRRS